MTGCLGIWTAYRTGGEATAFVLLGAALVMIMIAIFRRARRQSLLISAVILLAAFGSIVGIGIISNAAAEQEYQQYILAAETYRARVGQYPSSLRQLDPKRVGIEGDLKVGSSRVFMSDDEIGYVKFPRRYVFYNLNTKKTTSVGILPPLD